MRTLLVATAMLAAAAQSEAQTPAPAAAAGDGRPSLISSVAVQPLDSVLVRAAKRAVASRKPLSQRRLVSVTSTRGRYSESTGTQGALPSPLADRSSEPPPPPSRSAVAAAERERAVQEKLQQLSLEQQRMAAEAEEPYGGDVSEDQVDQRLNQIPQEQQEAVRPPQ
jgi:hypothetical protein